MKRVITLVISCLALTVLLFGCGKGNQEVEPIEEKDPATVAIQEFSEDDTIPYETIKLIQSDIERELSSIGAVTDQMSLYVMDGNDSNSISILIGWEGMVLAVQFPDYVNASIIHINEVAQKHNLAVSDYDIGFSRGEGEVLTWHSTDGISGELFDSYDSDTTSFQDQTVQDLVDRYGCTNEFYDISEYEAQN